MLVSVIVPVYNVEDYLRECLDSVAGQTYKDIEVIMVDDGSTDGSGAICDEFATKYGNFSVIHKANAGLGKARNTGMEHMKGEYVTFLDSDDYIAPDLIERLLETLTEKQVDMCKAGFYRITNEKVIRSSTKYENKVYQGTKAREWMFPRMIGSRPDAKDSIEMCVCGVLYKATHIYENKLLFPSERELISEDLVFNMEYLQCADGACTVEYIGYYYRMNPESLTKRYRADRFAACKYFYLEMYRRLVALQYDDMTILRLSRMFFINIRMCIRQENRGISGLSGKQALEHIKEICVDEVVQSCVREYPIKALGIRQRIFLMLIRYQMAGLLLFFSERGAM